MNIDELKKYKNRNDIRMDELLNITNYFIELMVPDQPSERVSKKLTDRNVRYYINQELVDRPVGKEGLVALYGYRHLLQLIALKRLQTSYLPVKKIAELIKDKTEVELLSIVVSPEFKNENQIENPALSFLNSIASTKSADKETASVNGPSMTYGDKRDVRSRPVNLAQSRLISWDRYELDDGIEIHIRSDQDKKFIKSKIKNALNELLHSL